MEYDNEQKYGSYIISEATNFQARNQYVKWLTEFKKKYSLGFYFEIINFILSLICCCLYVYSTYDPIIYIKNNSLFMFTFSARFYFLCDFVLTISTSKSDNKFSLFYYIAFEVATTIPFIIMGIYSGLQDNFTSNIYMIINSIITLRIYRIEYISKYIQSEVNRKLYTITCSIFSLLIFSTAFVNVVENTQSIGKYWLFLPRDCDWDDLCKSPNPSFHNTFFFVITTVATIGYYSYIVSVAGRIVIIVLIIITIIKIPSKSSELMKQLTLKSIFSRTNYKRIYKVNFVIITGNISNGPVVDLLQEYFHPDHGENERHALILMPTKPDLTMKSLLQEYTNKLFYFQGDPLKESDLKRCQYQHASTIIILCNKQTDDPIAEDSRTILLAMAIRKYLMQGDVDETKIKVKLSHTTLISGQNKRLNDNKLLIQLIRPESELHFALSVSKKNYSDQILCIDELKQSLLAKSCLCNGIIALVSNLIMTSNLENINPKILEKNRWLKDYRKGKGLEIYKIQLDFLRGYSFADICDVVYTEKGIIIFGLNIEAKNDGSSIVLLNPNDFIIPNNPDVIFYGYCLAENKQIADDIVAWYQSKKRMHIELSSSIRTEKDENGNFTKKNLRNPFRKKSTMFQDEFDTFIDELSAEEKEINDLYSTEAITFSKICHVTSEPIAKESVTFASIDNLLIAKGHIIMCGLSHNLIDFIKPLRARHLPKSVCLPIVIINKDLPDEKLWSTIAFFDQIYLIHGDPMNKSDLKKAGIKYAKRVVILAPSIQEISEFTYNKRMNQRDENDTDDNSNQTSARKLTREEENLLDAKTIFKYNMISKLKKDIFITVELINPKNVSFLYNKNREQNDEYRFINNGINIDGTASFAAGEVYFSSIMDNLIIQSYYNPSLLSVLKKLIIGQDQSIYKKAPLNRFKDVISSNMHLIDFNVEHIKLELAHSSGKLFEENETINRKITFKEVFLTMLRKGIIVLGIYRACSCYFRGHKNTFNLKKSNQNSNNIFYYVLTAPEPNYEINARDKLFVLSQSFPNDEYFKKFNMAEVKKNSDEDTFMKNENLPFQKNTKKSEDKKENYQPLDLGEQKKIKEINSTMTHIIQELILLGGTAGEVIEKINTKINDSVSSKVKSLYENHIQSPIHFSNSSDS